jgi:20S proteasome alpha/beta subunit|eukprot:COSAG01_NODE_271_length_19794_cov_73.630890_5_plen_129_part_00
MSTHATASFVRRELATAIRCVRCHLPCPLVQPPLYLTALHTLYRQWCRRKGPYSVNMLIAGYDLPGAGEVAAGVDPAAGTTGLYWIDYLGNMRKLAYGAHGYCGYFIMSTFDRYYRCCNPRPTLMTPS